MYGELTWCSILLVHRRTLAPQFSGHCYHWGNSHKWEFMNKMLNHFLKLVSVELVEHLTQWWVDVTMNNFSYSSDTESNHMHTPIAITCAGAHSRCDKASIELDKDEEFIPVPQSHLLGIFNTTSEVQT